MNKDLKLVNSYDFNNIDDLYNYIFDSYINGNKEQSKELFNQLWNKNSFFDFIKNQLKDNGYYIEHYQYIKFLESLLCD